MELWIISFLWKNSLSVFKSNHKSFLPSYKKFSDLFESQNLAVSLLIKPSKSSQDWSLSTLNLARNQNFLHHLNLTFFRCDTIIAEAFESLFEGPEAINSFKHLGFNLISSKFDNSNNLFSFSCNQINDSSVEKISPILTKFTSLN